MNFNDYLLSTIEIAEEEKEILDMLSPKEVLSPIELQASK